MKRFTAQAVMSLILAGCLTLSQAGPAAIGTVITAGSLQLDNVKVSGNATIFDGARIESGAVPSELHLNNGTRMSLGAGTRGRVYLDHIMLEKGEGQFESAGGYAVRTRNLRISPESAGSKGRILLASANKVQVAALVGRLRVTNAEGILVARVGMGSALEFEPQAAGAAAPSRVSGCLEKQGDRYLLTDQTSNVTVELQGAALATEAGNRVEIVGTLDPSAKPAAGASQLIQVTQVKRLGKGCRSTKGGAAAGAAAGGAAGAAAGAAVGGTTIAVIGGVAAAATLGGLAVAEKLPGQGGGNPSASR